MHMSIKCHKQGTVQATGHVTIFDLGARLYTTLTELHTKLQNVELLFGSHVRQVTPKNQGQMARNRNVIQYGGGALNSPQILSNNQLDALFHVFIYFMSLHVSSVTALIIRRSNCINTSSGMISLCK